MKKQCFFWIWAVLIFSAGVCFGDTPHQVGPFVLNRNISDFNEFVRMETALPIRYMENIKEVEIRPIKGFKSGLIAYASCAAPGRIVRIKLKYTDSSKKFYEKLLKNINKRFGKSDDYQGDPFGIVVGWKWSFVDTDNNRISLRLQHNTRDEEEKMGNSIKLTITSLIEQDIQCQQAKEDGQSFRKHLEAIEIEGLDGWDLFTPR